MNVDVTVVVPTVGRTELLRCAVGTALGQDGVAVEVVVVDDASADATGPLESDVADPRLRVVRHPTRRGVSAARNSGIEAARGR